MKVLRDKKGRFIKGHKVPWKDKVGGNTRWKKGQIPWNKDMKGYGKGHIVSEETREKISQALSGRIFTKEWREKISISSQGHKRWLGKKHKEESRQKMSLTKTTQWKDQEYANHMSDIHKGQRTGEANNRWKGGITLLTSMIRNLPENKQWKKAVFQKDDYKCQVCGERGGSLEAHHKKSFSEIFREFLREFNQFSPFEDKNILVRLAIKYAPFWNVDNGETECKKCHDKTKGRVAK